MYPQFFEFDFDKNHFSYYWLFYLFQTTLFYLEISLVTTLHISHIKQIQFK